MIMENIDDFDDTELLNSVNQNPCSNNEKML